MKIIKLILSMVRWRKQMYQPPVPYDVKLKTLEKFNLPDSTWVETGTFYGETTLFLSQISKKVFTIEASAELYSETQKKFSENKKINSIFGKSQRELPKILEKLSGNVCFWLDAHFCGPNTFDQDTHCPIVFELESIFKKISNFKDVNILIDDIRDFSAGRSDYPDKNMLIHLAGPLISQWEIINDILIFQRKLR